MKINVQAKRSGIKISQGNSKSSIATGIATTKPETSFKPSFGHQFGHQLCFLHFHFFEACNRPLDFTPYCKLSAPLHHYGYGSTSHSTLHFARPLSTPCLLHLCEISTNHTGQPHRQFYMAKRSWKSGMSAWKVEHTVCCMRTCIFGFFGGHLSCAASSIVVVHCRLLGGKVRWVKHY